MQLEGKIAVITGASRGVGRQMMRDFAKAGAAAVVGGARTAKDLEAIRQEVEGLGAACLIVVGDLATEAGCKMLIDEALAQFGRIDVLVNSLGIAGPTVLARDLSLHDWNEVLAANLTSAFLCAKFALESMMERRSGVIVNISSNAGKHPSPMRLPYAVSKIGLVGLTRSLAQEVGSYGIRVNCVTPGPIEGERLDEVIAVMAAAANKEPATMRAEFLSWSPLRRVARPEDIVSMVLYLSSELGQHITGQDINVNGGTVMY